jgi:hypothetical protein
MPNKFGLFEYEKVFTGSAPRSSFFNPINAGAVEMEKMKSRMASLMSLMNTSLKQEMIDFYIKIN